MNSQAHDEILDIINEADQVIGSASRREIHASGLSHRAVHIFLFNSLGEIYVQKRSKHKDNHPLKLDSSAAGHIDSGEDYFEAAHRELMEELNLRADLVEELRFGPDIATDNERVVLYTCISDHEPKPNPDEIVSGSFWRPAELTRAMSERPAEFVPAFVLLWELYRNKRS